MESAEKIIVFECSWEFSQSRGIGWKTSVPQDIAPGQLNDVLDKLRDAVLRQDKWHALYSLEAKIRFEEERLLTALNNLKRIEEAYPDIGKAPTDERHKYRDQRTVVLSQDALVKMLQEQHTVLHHQLNGAGASGGEG